MNEQRLQPGQFSLGTLFLLTTVIAVCCGAFVAHPNLGTAALVVGIPALARTIVDVRRSFRAGVAVTLSFKIVSYLESVFVTLAGIFSAIVVLLMGFSFVAINFDFVSRQDTLPNFVMFGATLAVIIGSFAASGILFYMIYWRTIPKRNPPVPPSG